MTAPATGTGQPAHVYVWRQTCEACRARPAVARLVWPTEDAVLCGVCLDDARELLAEPDE